MIPIEDCIIDVDKSTLEQRQQMVAILKSHNHEPAFPQVYRDKVYLPKVFTYHHTKEWIGANSSIPNISITYFIKKYTKPKINLHLKELK